MKRLVWIVGFVALLLGAWALLRTIDAYRASSEVSTWPTIDGRVTESILVAVRQANGTRDEPRVTYRYSVDGVDYQSRRVSFRTKCSREILSLSSSGFCEDKGLPRATTEKYPAEQQVTVHYNPNDPAIAFLEPRSGIDSWWIVSAVSFLIGVTMVVLALRQPRRSPSAI